MQIQRANSPLHNNLDMDKVVLITGASGLLGRAILRIFEEAGWQAFGLAFSRASRNSKLIRVELRDFAAVNDVVSEKKPSIIVHCAAEKNPDAAEKQHDATDEINVKATENLANVAAANKALLIYISTDSVFDGFHPPYEENSSDVNPVNYYGKTKLSGEHVTLSHNGIVLRIPFLYGPVDEVSESSMLTLFRQLEESNKRVVLLDYDLRYPTHVDDVARAVLTLAESFLRNNSSVKGAYHYAGQEGYTKYQMAVLLSKLFQLPHGHLVADPNPPSSGANRSQDPRLLCSRLASLRAPEPRPFGDGVKQVIQDFKLKTDTGSG
ncbi:methionine adenosyltransferase 2 subunit beta-like [Paramacrobiotus metropolitanus]|uniref:methionine adenosyltransferase 2 subunit beta-like n=1 Tax=Paramacrobiotus metropolitanus TaxID=2943436 RepID=UPI0024457F64|nr:methionine adenosyltransferase 2 subunit beta-like [Paramacrobiotus metropolitanus]